MSLFSLPGPEYQPMGDFLGFEGVPIFPPRSQYIGLIGSRGCPYFPTQVRNISPWDFRASLFSHPGPRIGGCPYFPTQVQDISWWEPIVVWECPYFPTQGEIAQAKRESLFSHPGGIAQVKRVSLFSHPGGIAETRRMSLFSHPGPGK